MRLSQTMDVAQTIGLFGAVLAGIAYLPQITHLIKEKCSAGISREAYYVWLIASGAVLINALSIKATVFILLSSIQLVSTLLIIFFSNRYKGTCAFHARLYSKGSK
jgi:uncharacterized protein with PQ loop repeat